MTHLLKLETTDGVCTKQQSWCPAANTMIALFEEHRVKRIRVLLEGVHLTRPLTAPTFALD